MNKKVLSKLKMEKPEYYDSTDSKAAIIQKPKLEKTLNKFYWHGFQLGSLMGTLGLGASSLFALITAQSFNSFLNIDGSTWKAIFILLFISSSVMFLILLIVNFLNFLRGNFKESRMVDEFFEEDKKI